MVAGRERRVRVGWRGVEVGGTVDVLEGKGVGVRKAVFVGPVVDVDTNAVTAC